MSRNFSNEQLLGIINKKGYKISGNAHVQREDTKLECAACDEPLEASQVEEGDAGRYVVRISSHRSRLLDEDNLSGKAATDFIRYCHIIPSDAPETTHIVIGQKKVKKGEEKTVVTIDRLPA